MDNSTELETAAQSEKKVMKPIRVLRKPIKKTENTNSTVPEQKENNLVPPQGSVESLGATVGLPAVFSDFVRDSPLV